tara:strand:+ start:1169 stop:1558 length:390 start_codon:yes stop_codon:yes gene_type:complete
MILRTIISVVGGLFLLRVGILHFTDTGWFEPIVPPMFGPATFWVLVSGAAEIIIGLGLILPRTRKIAGYACAALLVGVYPANVYMWMYDIELGDGTSLSPTGHVVRLLLQLMGIAISLWIARNPPESKI